MNHQASTANLQPSSVNSQPDLAESHLWRGVIYSQRGEKQKAMADLKAALKGLNDPKLKQRAEEELRKLK
jgi:regulator of sirC expression with transglutaminase-like and TPR domain